MNNYLIVTMILLIATILIIKDYSFFESPQHPPFFLVASLLFNATVFTFSFCFLELYIFLAKSWNIALIF